MRRTVSRRLWILGMAGVGAFLLTVPYGGEPAPLEATTTNPCAAVTTQALRSLERTIEGALRSAEADVRANGKTGRYAVAATNSRDLLIRSRDRIREAAASLPSGSGTVTNYAQAGQIKEYVRTTFDWLSTAGHWALISAAYHRSTDAQQTFDGTVRAIGEAQALFGESGRCFIAPYLSGDRVAG